MKKNKKISYLISFAIGFIVFVLWFFGSLDVLENKLLDFRFSLRGQAAQYSRDIAIVEVDEESIKQFGRWPWNRSIHAHLVDRLKSYGAKTIVFDVLFTDADNDHPQSDDVFAASINNAGNVVLNWFFEKKPNGETEVYAPISKLANAAKALGYVNTIPDSDGVTRRSALFEESKEGVAPSLAMAGLSVYLDESFDHILESKKVEYDEYNRMLINFAGTLRTFPYYSFDKVVDGIIPAEKFKDKIVLVGGTATALFDLKVVPTANIFPGVEVHANVMSNILLNNFLKNWPGTITLALIVFFAVFTGLVFNKFSPFWSGALVFLLLALYSAINYYLFAVKNIHADLFAPALSLSLSYIGVLFHRYITEEREKRELKTTFSRYFSPRVMEKIVSDPSSLVLGGKRQNLTVLFSDIRDFTTMSEQLESNEVVAVLNEYLSKMVDVVFKYDGTLDKFIGDAVMAFWGAPIPQVDHPRRAVLCAIEMLEELKKLQEKWKSEGKRLIEIGIGVNTGDMTVGNMGSRQKMEYTVIGDNVNLGSRLEGLNKEYATRIIISDSTYQAVKEIIEAKHIGQVKVKGKAKLVDVYSVLGRKGAAKEAGFNPESRININKAEIG